MSEKSIKEQIRESEDELLNLKIQKARTQVKKLQKREVVRNARGEIVKTVVRDAAGRPLNRVKGDEE